MRTTDTQEQVWLISNFPESSNVFSMAVSKYIEENEENTAGSKQVSQKGEQ